MHSNQIISLSDNRNLKNLDSPFCFNYGGGYFQLTQKGVVFIGRNKNGNKLPPYWLCSPLKITAKTRDANNGPCPSAPYCFHS